MQLPKPGPSLPSSLCRVLSLTVATDWMEARRQREPFKLSSCSIPHSKQHRSVCVVMTPAMPGHLHALSMREVSLSPSHRQGSGARSYSWWMVEPGFKPAPSGFLRAKIIRISQDGRQEQAVFRTLFQEEMFSCCWKLEHPLVFILGIIMRPFKNFLAEQRGQGQSIKS